MGGGFEGMVQDSDPPEPLVYAAGDATKSLPPACSPSIRQDIMSNMLGLYPPTWENQDIRP